MNTYMYIFGLQVAMSIPQHICKLATTRWLQARPPPAAAVPSPPSPVPRLLRPGHEPWPRLLTEADM